MRMGMAGYLVTEDWDYECSETKSDGSVWLYFFIRSWQHKPNGYFSPHAWIPEWSIGIGEEEEVKRPWWRIW